MGWWGELLDKLAEQPVCGYAMESTPATEPTALVAMALAAANRREAARPAAEWLAACQATDGSIGVRRDEATPCWPTSLAMLAWLAVGPSRYSRAMDAALAWTLAARGEPLEPHTNVGHNSLLVAWPWVTGTHSWIEPTALHVLSLKATQHGDHPRCREAVELLLDRQLESGGCNYGNTVVLGQTLRPHVQPTGLALWALANEPAARDATTKAARYLRGELSARTSTASLSWALLGLTAAGQRPTDADLWLASAYQRNRRRDQSPYKNALLALALTGFAIPPQTWEKAV